jgi:manganese/iron transport system substrate-binding protein
MRNPRRTLRLDISRWMSVAVLVAGLVIAGCSSPDDAAVGSTGPTPAPDAIRVVATTSVLADLVRQVGGPNVDATSLVPPGGEVHTFDPTPADIARVADAHLVVTNGLGLDDWVQKLARDSGSQAPIVALGEDLEGVSYLEGEGGAGTANPHVWMDVGNAIQYTKRIGEQLAAIDVAHANAYEAGSASYDERLTVLDDWARDQIEAVPAERRKVVSFHDAFPYFAKAYGLEIVGTVIDAPGQDPSAGEIADLIDAIRASGASALFGEAQFNPQLAQTIAGEAGISVVTDLYTDSLGDPPADTYEGMIRWDVERVVGALQP